MYLNVYTYYVYIYNFIYIVLSTAVTPESLEIIILCIIRIHKTILFIVINVIIHLDVSNALIHIYNTDECIKLFSDTLILNELCVLEKLNFKNEWSILITHF